MSTTTRLQKFYLAYFGRPADVEGLLYWSQDLARNLGGDEVRMGGYFGNASQPEFTSIYGASTSTTEFINAVFNNLFGRNADNSGLTYWITQYNQFVTQGQSPQDVRAKMVVWIMDGAQDAPGFLDLTTLNNRVSVAQSFTTQLDTAAEQIAYINAVQGSPGNHAGTVLIEGVRATTPPAEVDVAAAIAGMTAQTSSIGTQTFVMTERSGVLSSAYSTKFTPSGKYLSAGSDLIAVARNGLDSATILDPEPTRDRDVLSADLTGGTFAAGLVLSNIEQVNLYTSMTGPLSLLNVVGTNEMNISGLTAQFTQYAGHYLALTQGYASTLTITPLTPDTPNGVILKGTAALSSIVNVTSRSFSLDVQADSTLTALTTGAGSVTLTGVGALTLGVVTGALYLNGGALTGSLTYVESGIPTQTGGGNDQITLGAATTATLQLGGGNDRVTAVSNTGLNAGDFIDFGSGTDSLVMTGNGLVLAAHFDNIRGLEQLTLANTTTNVTIKAHDKLVESGSILTVSANTLTTGLLDFDGRLELDGAFQILSGGGNDRITTAAGNDTVRGGGGADIIATGAGSDTITLDLADVAGTVEAADRLTDFDPDNDTLVLYDTDFEFYHGSASNGVLVTGGAAVSLDVLATVSAGFTYGVITTNVSGATFASYLAGNCTMEKLELAIIAAMGSASNALFSADAKFLIAIDDGDHTGLIWIESDGADNALSVDEISVLAIIQDMDDARTLSPGHNILFM